MTEGESVTDAEPAADESRIELPRTHWVEVRDAWDITERERNSIQAEVAGQIKASRPARRANAGLAGTAPQRAGADDGEDIEAEMKARAESGHALIRRFVLAWGGPLLDGKDITQENIDALPAPLFNAIDQAVQPVLGEVFPGVRRRPDGDPTTP